MNNKLCFDHIIAIALTSVTSTSTAYNKFDPGHIPSWICGKKNVIREGMATWNPEIAPYKQIQEHTSVISEKNPITSATRSALPLLWILSFSTSVTKALPITKERTCASTNL